MELGATGLVPVTAINILMYQRIVQEGVMLSYYCSFISAGCCLVSVLIKMQNIVCLYFYHVVTKQFYDVIFRARK